MTNKMNQNSEGISPVGWYIAAYLLRFTSLGEENGETSQEYTAWENTILVEAGSPDEAYEKALVFAASECEPYEDEDGQTVKFEFEGLTSLLPIYEELKDGAEIIWVEHSHKTRRQLQAMVKQKHELEIFEEE